MLEELLAPAQVGYSELIASMERLEKEMRVVRQRFGDDEQDLWKSIHIACIQKICPKILRDHLAAQASSIDAPEKQRLTVEKFLQASVHGPGASPMDVDAIAKTKGGKQGGKGKDKSGKPGKFDGKCFCVWRVWSHGGGLSEEGGWETENGTATTSFRFIQTQRQRKRR